MAAIPDGPIAGESLTNEPGNAPWEQPPLHADPQKALVWYIQKFDDEEKVDDLIFLLDQGFPLNVLVESMLSFGVMNGIHTLDISILIGPVIHEYLKALGEAAGVTVKETDGPSKEERMAKKQRDRLAIMIQNAVDQGGDDNEIIQSMSDDFGGGKADEPETGVPEPMEPSPEVKGNGFIQRRK